MKILGIVLAMLLMTAGTASAGLFGGLICNKKELDVTLYDARKAPDENLRTKEQYAKEFNEKLNSRMLDRHLNVASESRRYEIKKTIPKELRDKAEYYRKRDHVSEDYKKRSDNLRKYIRDEVQRVVRRENLEKYLDNDQFLKGLPIEGVSGFDETYEYLDRAKANCRSFDRYLSNNKACRKVAQKKGYDTLCGRVHEANEVYDDLLLAMKEKLKKTLVEDEDKYTALAKKRLEIESQLHQKIEGESEKQAAKQQQREAKVVKGKYRGLAWGSQPTKAMKLIGSMNGEYMYTRKEPLELGGIKAKDIIYHYAKPHGLMYVRYTFPKSVNPVLVNQYLEKKYGEGNYQSRGAVAQVIWDNKTTFSQYIYNREIRNDDSILMVVSNAVYSKFKQ